MVDIEKIKSSKSIKELLEFGIVNIDKPSGPTSFETSERIMKSLGLRKTSHFGTLDPKVTGVLPVALNRACKLTGFFLGEDKEYVGIMKIHNKISLKGVEEKIKEEFLGKIKQLPPVKSRVKRQTREREIKGFEILEKEDQNFLFKVECEGGTYIRKLVHDLGQALGTGAHMLELRRVRAGIFTENENSLYTGPSVNLFEFEEAVEEYKKGNGSPLKEIIIPGEIVVQLFPEVQVKKQAVERLLHGSPILKEWIETSIKIKGRFCAFNKDRFIGIYRASNEKDIFGRPEFVLQPL